MKYFFPILLILFCSCSAYRTQLNPQKQLTNLYVDVLPVDDTQSSESLWLFSQAVDDVILQFNSEGHPFKIQRGQQEQFQDQMIIWLHQSDFVTPGEQATATAVNVLGLVLVPTAFIASGASFFLGFYYFPDDRSVIQLELSGDITPGPMSPPIIISNSGYLRSLEKQYSVHQGKIHNYLLNYFRQLSNDYQKVRHSNLNQKVISANE